MGLTTCQIRGSGDASVRQIDTTGGVLGPHHRGGSTDPLNPRYHYNLLPQTIPRLKQEFELYFPLFQISNESRTSPQKPFYPSCPPPLPRRQIALSHVFACFTFLSPAFLFWPTLAWHVSGCFAVLWSSFILCAVMFFRPIFSTRQGGLTERGFWIAPTEIETHNKTCS